MCGSEGLILRRFLSSTPGYINHGNGMAQTQILNHLSFHPILFIERDTSKRPPHSSKQSAENSMKLRKYLPNRDVCRNVASHIAQSINHEMHLKHHKANGLAGHKRHSSSGIDNCLRLADHRQTYVHETQQLEKEQSLIPSLAITSNHVQHVIHHTPTAHLAGNYPAPAHNPGRLHHRRRPRRSHGALRPPQTERPIQPDLVRKATRKIRSRHNQRCTQHNPQHCPVHVRLRQGHRRILGLAVRHGGDLRAPACARTAWSIRTEGACG